MRWRPAKMTSLVLVWTAVTCLCWTSGATQVPSQQKILYPKIHSSQTLTCECHLSPVTCDTVLWFRYPEGGDRLQFLASENSAGRGNSSEGRFKAKMKTSMMWSLHITNVMLEDAGVYSCVLKGKSTEGMWTPGVLLLPGVIPPTPTPMPKPTPKKPVCSCPDNSQKTQLPSEGCTSALMWPLASVLAGLVMVLLSTLYYFSRLPKKCRHNFVQRRL